MVDQKKITHKITFLLALNFIIGILLDFNSTIYSWFLRTWAAYPYLGDISLAAWIAISTILLAQLIKLFYPDKQFPLYIFILFYIFIFGATINLVANSIQSKLWALGYNDNLALGTATPAMLKNVDIKMLPMFAMIYFFDEYLGHFLLFVGYFALLIVAYSLCFTEKNHIFNSKFKSIRKKISSFFSTTSSSSEKYLSVTLICAGLNSLYFAWCAVEGQSIPLFSFFCLTMLIIKLYNHLRGYVVTQAGKTLEYIFSGSLVFIFIWFATIGKFSLHHMPQFFETIYKLI